MHKVKSIIASITAYLLFRLAVAVATGSYLIYFFISNADHDSVFGIAEYLVIATFTTVIFTLLFFADRKQYRIHHTLTAFLPTLLAIGFFVTLIFVLYRLGNRDNSPVKMHCATRTVDFNGIWIDFREDNTYKLTDATILGSDYYRGTYTIRDSIITLDTSNCHFFSANRLVIRPEVTFYDHDSLHTDTLSTRSVWQIDAQGHVIPDATDFIITDDQ